MIGVDRDNGLHGRMRNGVCRMASLCRRESIALCYCYCCCLQFGGNQAGAPEPMRTYVLPFALIQQVWNWAKSFST